METVMKLATRVFSAAILLAAGVMAGCSGDSSSGGNKISLGKIIGGRYGEQLEAGEKVFNAEKYEPDEDELGRTVAIAATNQWRLFDKPALTRYVTMVGLTLADSTSRPDGNWVFGVLDTP